MIKYFQNRFAFSAIGAKSLLSGIFFTTLLDMALMLPALFLFLFLTDYLEPILNPGASLSHGFFYYLLIALCFIAVLYVISYFQYASTYTNVYSESANRRISLAEKLRKLPLAFFGEKNLSDLSSTIMDDNTQLEHVFSHAVPQLFASIISIIFIAIGLFFYDWQLSIALFWVVPLAALILLLSKRMMTKMHQSHYYIKRKVTEQIQEGLECIQEIKSYNGEVSYAVQLDDCLASYEKSLVRCELSAGILLNISYVLLRLGLASVIIWGATMLSAGSLTLFSYLIFLMIASSIYNPISEVFNNIAVLAFLDVRIKRMQEMEQMPMQQGKTQYELKNYDLIFDEVSFAYEKDKEVLKNISFTATQGEVTALVGPSGGGKSTTAKLAARFWDVDGGKISLGGVDISTIDPEALLQNFAVVFQDVLLFNASVADNIRMGKNDASDEAIVRVAKLAQCHDFIESLPEGYDTLIGENGERLSGGERQRISIARALLKDAPIILLDEATASLDVENESKIQAGISELIRNKTVLIIAHRMRTVANAHKVVLISDGRVKETGTPAELIALGGDFAQMCARQQTDF